MAYLNLNQTPERGFFYGRTGVKREKERIFDSSGIIQTLFTIGYSRHIYGIC